MRQHLVPLAAAGLVALAGCTDPDEDFATRGIAPLTGPELVAMHSDKTILVENDDEGWVWTGFYRSDGTMRGRGEWDGGENSGSGVWEVFEDGLVCEDWDNHWGGGGYGCSAVYPDTDGSFVYVYRRGSVGDYPVQRARVIAGNPEGL